MSHRYQVFERDPLYGEVWAEPVQTVAVRYEISDVALRKICKKLGVPVPPLGYWAKVAAGKNPRAIPLPAKHDGQMRYVRTIFVDEAAPERQKRTAQLLSNAPPIALPAIFLQANLEDCHPVVRRTAKRLRAGTGHDREWLSVTGSDVFALEVTEAQRVRALLILDAVLAGLLASGATLVNDAKDDERVHLLIYGGEVGLRVNEKYDRYERDLTEKEKAEKLKQPNFFYLRDPWRHRATGKLKLSILSDNEFYPHATLSDGISTLLERRLDGLIEKIWAKAAEEKVKRQMDNERNARWELERRRREEFERARAAELKHLENTEKAVVMWRRAQELRAYARALAENAESLRRRGQQPENIAADVEWIRNAADWMDPIVRKPWPGVDREQ